ncbi:ATP-binding protein [Frankia sp. AgKG'84/4]|uniref:ATP-binding protein n=1 Tax=Frankia sp. AgKG'84/4 TaxID=573490 RepID=UPI00200C09DD|nr:ATP-binding protein [Frankia sp. AgKG'84/4]MCL9796237.1 ATP-binding protein [Frankia sp. AgKG'84/4]
MSASSVPMDVVRQATSRCPPATHILAELPYLPSAVPQARHVLRQGMRMLAIPEDARSTAELLVSELVTNAVKYGQPPLWLLIEMRPGLIHASVSDTSNALPQRRTVAPDAEGGRGLLVLDALAGSWGTVVADSGKYLWFDLPIPTESTRGETIRTATTSEPGDTPTPRAGGGSQESAPPAGSPVPDTVTGPAGGRPIPGSGSPAGHSGCATPPSEPPTGSAPVGGLRPTGGSGLTGSLRAAATLRGGPPGVSLSGSRTTIVSRSSPVARRRAAEPDADAEVGPTDARIITRLF